MRFELNDDQRAIAETARALLAARGPIEELWPELCELGWPGICTPEKHGGQGLGTLELTLLMRELGYACAPTPMLGSAVAALAVASAGSRSQQSQLLPRLAAGTELGALAIAGGRELVPDAASGGLIVLVSPDAGVGTIHRSVEIPQAEAIDSRRAHAIVEGQLSEGEPIPGDIRPAVDRAAIAVAAELVGLSRRALDLSVTYIKDRVQFGSPIGAFQAVQHNAAQMLRDCESASLATLYAAWVADHRPAELSVAAAMAKAAASATGRAVTAAAIQLHGGIGFTWEADLHWLFKRAQIGAAYLGGAEAHQTRIARALAARSG